MILKTMLLDRALSLPHSTVLHIDETHAYFLCECGSPYKLRNTNSAVSPEEYRCSRCKRRALVLDHIGERYLMKRIRSNAVEAGREFELTLEWLIVKCHEPCHYCGRVDTNSVTVRSKTDVPLLENFRYNGLDRIDNSIGYRPENCVPCCVVCNRAKNSMPYAEFTQWIQDMVQYQSNSRKVDQECMTQLHTSSNGKAFLFDRDVEY